MNDKSHVCCLLEAMLFVSPRPVPLKELADLAQTEEETTTRCLEELSDMYKRRGSSLMIRRTGGDWQMVVCPDYGEELKKHLRIQVKKGLSRASLETLALVSLLQPVTKGEIDLRRGADSATSVKNLLERGLITISGHREAPGKPFLYRVTPKFFHVFGIEDQEDLERLQKIASTPGGEEETA